MADTKDAGGQDRSSKVQITVIIHRSTFETAAVTGTQIKENAHIPAGFALYRRVQGGNEAIQDDAPVKLRNGDHFFARPRSNVSG